MMLYPSLLVGSKSVVHDDDHDDGEPTSGQISPTTLRFISASASKQHPIKSEMGMIDADWTEESPTLLGICDGVSEVQRLGIRPDDLPRELLQCLRENLESRTKRGTHRL